MIETQPTIDNGCQTCRGVGYVAVPIGEPDRPLNGTKRCPDCNPAPIAQVAEAENVRVFSDAKAKRRGNRREWWGE